MTEPKRQVEPHTDEEMEEEEMRPDFARGQRKMPPEVEEESTDETEQWERKLRDDKGEPEDLSDYAKGEREAEPEEEESDYAKGKRTKPQSKDRPDFARGQHDED